VPGRSPVIVLLSRFTGALSRHAAMHLHDFYTAGPHQYGILIRIPLLFAHKSSVWGLHHGHPVFDPDCRFLRCHGRAGLGLRASAEAVMTLFYVIGAVVSLLLFVYLVVALLKPELFS
jgi:K+-transporting ATPase KdpF subunit